MALTFTSRARALSELGLAILALSQDPWAPDPLSSEEKGILSLLIPALTEQVEQCLGVRHADGLALQILQSRLPELNVGRTPKS